MLVPQPASSLNFAGLAPAVSPATLRAYRSDLADWSRWCRRHGHQELPAAPESVAAYLVDLGQAGRRISTLERRCAALAAVHRGAGHESPTTSFAVRTALKRLKRTFGCAQRQVRPISADELRQMVAAVPNGLRGTRDRALLLVGWSGALRRSELAALQIEDLDFVPEGVTVTIRRSKTDQDGVGRDVGIPSVPQPCPVTAVRAWLAAAQLEGGPVFRTIGRWGSEVGGEMSPRAIAGVVKRSAARIGLDPETVAGHSLRSGLATSAAAAGATAWEIMDQGGWKSERIARGYVRQGSLYVRNAAAAALA